MVDGNEYTKADQLIQEFRMTYPNLSNYTDEQILMILADQGQYMDGDIDLPDVHTMETKVVLVGYSIIPDAVVLEVGDGPALTLARVKRYTQMTKKAICFASQEGIAKMRGVRKMTINNHLKVLVDAGYLVCVASGTGKPNVYKVTKRYEDALPKNAKLVIKGGNGEEK